MSPAPATSSSSPPGFRGVLQSGDITETSLSAPVSERQQARGDESRARERPLDSPRVSVCVCVPVSVCGGDE